MSLLKEGPTSESDKVAQYLVWSAFKYFQGQRFHRLSVQPAAVLNHSHCEHFFSSFFFLVGISLAETFDLPLNNN